MSNDVSASEKVKSHIRENKRTCRLFSPDNGQQPCCIRSRGFLGKCKKEGCSNSLPSFLPVTSETELYCYFHREDFASRFARNAVEKGKRRCSAVTFRGLRQCSRPCESDEIFCKRHLANPKALTVSQFQMSNSGSRINRDHWDTAWNTALYSPKRLNTEEPSRSNRKRTFTQAGLDD